MPFPRHLIHENEVVALDLRPHWWYFSRQILTGVPLLLLTLLVLGMDDGTGRTVLGWLVGIVAVVWALWLGAKYLMWSRTYFVVTSARVLYRTGFFARHGVEIPLDRVSNINFRQSFVERIVGAGTLQIQSAGEQGTSSFSHVRHPDGVQHELYRRIDAAEHRSATNQARAMADALPEGGGRAGSGSIPDQIQQLAELRDRGVITDVEFERKKTELLERM